MISQSSITDLIFFLILWLILLENSVSGFLMLRNKRQSLGCLFESGFSIVRMIFGRDGEEKRRSKLLKSKIFRIEYTIAWVAGLLMLIFLTEWIVFIFRNL